MIYQVRLWKGLVEPKTYRFQLEKAEKMTYLKRNLVILFLLSIVIYSISGFFGIGSESYSKQLLSLQASQYEMGKLLILLGNIVAGICFYFISIFLIALIFKLVTNADYMKLMVVQMLAFVLQLVEKAGLIPFYVLMDVNKDANPLSFGVVAQYIFSNDYWIHFFSEITLIQAIIILVQFYYVRKLTELNKSILLLVIISIHVSLWFANAGLSFLNVSVFI